MKRSDIPVSEVMKTDFVTLRSDDRLDLADDVMTLGRIRHMPVLEEKRLVGVVSQRDLLAASLSKALGFQVKERREVLHAVPVEEVMTRDVVTVLPETTVAEAARTLIRRKIGCLPVVDSSGSPVGLVTETDLLRAAYGLGSGEGT